MISLDYILSKEWNEKTQTVVLSSVDEMALRYDFFLGDIVMKVNNCDFSTNWGWVPVLDFAVSLNSIVTELSQKEAVELELDFTESDEFIKFSRKLENVFISASYTAGEAQMQLLELQKEAAIFANRLILNLTKRYPLLSENKSFKSLLSQLAKASLSGIGVLLKEMIKPFFSWLTRKGFVLCDEIYDSKTFGNELIVYKSPDLIIRFVSDRGDVYIDVASPRFPTEWFLLDNVLELIGHDSNKFIGDTNKQLIAFVEALDKDYLELIAFLEDSNGTRHRIDVLQQNKFNSGNGGAK